MISPSASVSSIHLVGGQFHSDVPKISQTQRIQNKIHHQLLIMFLHSISMDAFSIRAKNAVSQRKKNTTSHQVTKARKVDMLLLTLPLSILP